VTLCKRNIPLAHVCLLSDESFNMTLMHFFFFAARSTHDFCTQASRASSVPIFSQSHAFNTIFGKYLQSWDGSGRPGAVVRIRATSLRVSLRSLWSHGRLNSPSPNCLIMSSTTWLKAACLPAFVWMARMSSWRSNMSSWFTSSVSFPCCDAPAVGFAGAGRGDICFAGIFSFACC
jgi:hypothetical protein